MTIDREDLLNSILASLGRINELLSLSQRYEVASMLKDHKTYLEIAEKSQ